MPLQVWLCCAIPLLCLYYVKQSQQAIQTESHFLKWHYPLSVRHLAQLQKSRQAHRSKHSEQAWPSRQYTSGLSSFGEVSVVDSVSKRFYELFIFWLRDCMLTLRRSCAHRLSSAEPYYRPFLQFPRSIVGFVLPSVPSFLALP